MAEVPYELIIKIVMISIIVFFLIRFMNSVPKYNRVEGFAGVARGAGHPDCLRTLPEASQLLDILHGVNNVGDGLDASGDYKELELILSKMACLKKDLMAPGTQVDSTRYQAFETAHDRVAVAELCGLCLSKNISSRDLDISFATWRDRGNDLLRRLCTAANLKDAELKTAEMLFKKAFDDVYSVATSRCLKGNVKSEDESEVGAYDAPAAQELGPYNYTYGGLSASGWN
jgi:hypothetical protein